MVRTILPPTRLLEFQPDLRMTRFLYKFHKRSTKSSLFPSSANRVRALPDLGPLLFVGFREAHA